MPYPRRFSLFGRNFVLLYGSYYERYKKAVIRYHKSQLSNLDVGFRMEEAGKELVRRRNEARERGVGPLDPGYPDLHDVMDL
ncbi:hypothetical protein KC865_03420 [Candidatus Kaiserbacteria bacterium]|nr:hypothetical protein [Candidatus Kaiserbacteria bacterium]USN92613.1 MAG: hypothetical protein H6782_02250 [Candidatus Nomurabacteria bacterium]